MNFRSEKKAREKYFEILRQYISALHPGAGAFGQRHEGGL